MLDPLPNPTAHMNPEISSRIFWWHQVIAFQYFNLVLEYPHPTLPSFVGPALSPIPSPATSPSLSRSISTVRCRNDLRSCQRFRSRYLEILAANAPVSYTHLTLPTSDLV